MFISVRIVVVIIELFLEWFRISVNSFCLFSHTLSFISSIYSCGYWKANNNNNNNNNNYYYYYYYISYVRPFGPGWALRKCATRKRKGTLPAERLPKVWGTLPAEKLMPAT